MPLSEFERVRIEKLFKAYCESKVPAHVRNKLQVTFKIRGSEVKLFECRPHFDDPATWGEMAIARFKKDEKRMPGSCTVRIETADGISLSRTRKAETSQDY